MDFGIGGASFRLLAVHLGLLRRSRKKQVEAIIEAADPHPLRHVIVIGDKNEWRLEGVRLSNCSSHILRKFRPSYRAIPRVIRFCRLTGFS